MRRRSFSDVKWVGEVVHGSPQGSNDGESKRHTWRAVMPRNQGQAFAVRAAITREYLTQKKRLGRTVDPGGDGTCGSNGKQRFVGENTL